MKRLTVALRRVLLSFFLLACFGLPTGRADTNSSTAQPLKADETNAQETLRSFLQVQEQLHATQLAIEQNRKEAEQNSVKNAEALAVRLQAIEGALASQRAHELEAMQSSNRVMLFMAGTFAVVGFASMLLMAYFQWRTVHGLAEISTGLPASRALGPGSTLAALPAGDPRLVGTGPVEQSNARLLGALEQLEKRIRDLERTTRPALEQGAPDATGNDSHATQPNGNGHRNGNDPSAADPAVPGTTSTDPDGDSIGARVKTLLHQGQTCLDEDKPDAALASFEQVLELCPGHAEALVKKGVTLERLQKLEEALACYDAAIAADNSLTIAYLHKGGVFNRMEKFGDALECYEKALRTQEKRGI